MALKKSAPTINDAHRSSKSICRIHSAACLLNNLRAQLQEQVLELVVAQHNDDSATIGRKSRRSRRSDREPATAHARQIRRHEVFRNVDHDRSVSDMPHHSNEHAQGSARMTEAHSQIAGNFRLPRASEGGQDLT
jgi:hypothetical protein